MCKIIPKRSIPPNHPSMLPRSAIRTLTTDFQGHHLEVCATVPMFRPSANLQLAIHHYYQTNHTLSHRIISQSRWIRSQHTTSQQFILSPAITEQRIIIFDGQRGCNAPRQPPNAFRPWGQRSTAPPLMQLHFASLNLSTLYVHRRHPNIYYNNASSILAPSAQVNFTTSKVS